MASLAALLGSPRRRVLALLAALALARALSHRRARRCQQLALHRSLSLQLASAELAAGRASPADEWIEVAADAQAPSLVYYPRGSSDANDGDALVLLLPGNPGVPHFLLPLAMELFARTGAKTEVRCLGHAGHVAPWKNDGRLFSLQEQVDLKIRYVGARLKDNPKLRLVLVGHSIGCFLALQVAKEFPDAVDKIVLMQPAMQHMAQTPKGKEMRPVFAFHRQAVGLVRAIELALPVAVRQWLVTLATGRDLEPVLHHASLSLVDAEVMHNVLHMAKLEMQEVHEVDEQLLRANERKLLFVYSAIDGWAPPEFVQQYQLSLPRARHRVVSQGHAFMMEPNGTRDMAAHIAAWLNEDQ